MSNDNSFIASPTSTKHPKGLYMLFMVEMWERFNYYGMRALLTLFMIGAVINFSKEDASQIYGTFVAFVYLAPLFGGYIADKFIGKRHSITIGALFITSGQIALACYELLPPRAALFMGLTLIIIGNGFFKPNVSAIVGELYTPKDVKRDAGFTIFYMGINLGAFLSPLIVGFLGQPIDIYTIDEAYKWKWGFLTAAAGMIVGLIVYLTCQKKFLGNIGLQPTNKAQSGKKIINEPLSSEDWDKIKSILILTSFAVFFMAFYEQAATSLTYFANEGVELIFMGIPLKSSYFQAINPIFILILAPFFSRLWIKLGTKNPSTPSKFAFGLIIQAVAFLIIALGASIFMQGSRVSVLWLVCFYFLDTIAELCISPVGLSVVTKLSPLKFVSFMMGLWLAANFIGSLIAGFFASFYEEMAISTLFLIPSVCCVVFGGVLFLFNKKIKGWMHGIK
ncbi:MAG: peptide MFS transporter [Elusimicrobiota bacterium]|jgi:POT family proton-dependent oligopeptide transporter|nr:peptide MFS transporter [Elusimicrobiota bacterium]